MYLSMFTVQFHCSPAAKGKVALFQASTMK